MSGQADNLKFELKRFGFESDEALIFLHLTEHGAKTALSLSRELKFARTKIYRILEKLIFKGYVKEEILDYGTKFIAESYEKLNLIISEKEDELNDLKLNAPNLFNKLAILTLQSSEEIKVLYYRGVEGLKQISWNSTKVEGKFRIYEIDNLDSLVDNKFAEKCRMEFAKKPANKFFQLTNKTKFEDFTKVTAHIKQWNVSHIPKSTLNIIFEIHMYNDVTCMLDYTDKDVFIVEIYNQKLTSMQKEIYDLIWKQAKPMRIISPYGAAIL